VLQPPEPEPAAGVQYPLIYRWKKYNPALFGRRCRFVTTGAKNSVLIELDDGTRHVVSRYAVRQAPNPKESP
jgi:hypothetical protein